MNQLILGDCLEVMKKMDSESVDLIYLDPPFFSNRNYEVIWGDKGEVHSFEDRWSGGIEYYIAWLKERVAEMHCLLKLSGSIYLLLLLFAFSTNIYSQTLTAEHYFESGNAKYALEDYRGAIEDYNKVIEINPNYADAYYNRGNAKAALEDYKGAIEDYNKAIEINPNYTDAYYNRGIAKYDLKDYRGAKEDYNKAIEINPNYAKAYNDRGSAKDALGDKESACLDWSKAGELGLDKANDLIKEYCK